MPRLILSLLVLVLAIPCVAQVPFHGMRARIPSNANSLILINADKIFGSRVANAERWDARRKAAYDAGLLALPPDATEVILAGKMDHEIGESLWESALIRLSKPASITAPAQKYGGSIDTIAGRSASRLPNDSYIIELTDTLFASYIPANRQEVSRWLRSTDVSGPERLSPYLQKAFDYATKVGSPIIMALDTQGVISETEVKGRLSQSELFKSSGIDLDAAAKLISGVKGVTLGVTLNDDKIGAIRVDFSDAPGPIAKIAKPVLLGVLSTQGAMIEDFESWQPSMNGNTFQLSGKLSTEGTRKILSVLELPSSLADAAAEASSPGNDPEESKQLISTQHYYSMLTTMMEDLRTKPKKDHVKTFGQAAMWYDRYARKIDNLPILNVDPELVDFGGVVADSFRNAESFMKGVGMRSKMRTSGNNPSSGGFYTTGGGYRAGMGYHGGMYGSAGYSVSMGPVQASVREKGRTDAIIRGQERTKGAASVQEIWQQLDSATSDVRRKMTEKYQVEF